jgi:hypothetical protein
MPERPANDGKPWTRDELVIAFELYCRTPFQKTKANNPDVRRTALLLKRTAASVARKLGNFGAFDPQLWERGISGLVHVSRLDREIWEEFHEDWNSLVESAHRLRQSLSELKPEAETFTPRTGPSERLRLTRERLHQSFFRDAVLSSYDCRCCITGINVQECLIASHIVPWACNERYRSDPTNGLCLSATFDRLFDSGLITIDTTLKVEVSPRLLEVADRASRTLIACYHGKPIMPPMRFLPSRNHLEWHRANVFRS